MKLKMLHLYSKNSRQKGDWIQNKINSIICKKTNIMFYLFLVANCLFYSCHFDFVKVFHYEVWWWDSVVVVDEMHYSGYFPLFHNLPRNNSHCKCPFLFYFGKVEIIVTIKYKCYRVMLCNHQSNINLFHITGTFYSISFIFKNFTIWMRKKCCKCLYISSLEHMKYSNIPNQIFKLFN